jgi:acetyltransferase-like isoleucine patch superfamily enzyme
MAGVTIGTHAIIGANSVVTRDIPDYCVAAGIPSRIIKRYDFKTRNFLKTDPKGNFI